MRIFHVPSLDFSSTEHEIGSSGVQWSMESSFAGLSRVQPNFSTGGLTAAAGSSSGDCVSDELWRVAAARVGGGARDGVQPKPADALYAGAAGRASDSR